MSAKTNTVGSLVHTINAHKADINQVSFSADTLATCSGDKTIRLWDLEHYSELPSSPLLGHTYSIHCCTFSSTGNLLATCSTDGKVILWEPKTGRKISTFEHKSQTSIRVCRFSPNSMVLATGSDDESMCLWDVAGKRLLRSLEGHEASVIACAFSPDNTYIVSGSGNGDLRIWDAKYGHGKYLLYEMDAHDLGVTSCDFSPTYGSAGAVDSSVVTQIHFLLATCGYDNNVKLWDILTVVGSASVQMQLRDTLAGHTGHVMACCFSPSGKLLASGGGDKSVRLWNPLKGEPVYTIEGHSRYVTCCAFSHDSELLATGSNDKFVKIWKMVKEDDLSDAIPVEDILVDLSEAPPKKVSLSVWSVDDICRWLNELGLSQYEDNFRQNAIDGTELSSLTLDTLEKHLGVRALGHRNKILRAIQCIPEHPVIQPTDGDEGIPDEYLCPITREVMQEPVIASDGYTYERAAITSWMKSGKTRSPMTNAILTNSSLTPNRSLKMLIQRHVQGST